MGANVNAAGIAKNMPQFARQIQRTRMGRDRMAPESQQGDPRQFQALLNQASTDEQKQNAAPAPGALQKEGGQEQGRQRNVGQGEAEGRPGQGPQVQGTQEGQRRRRMS